MYDLIGDIPIKSKEHKSQVVEANRGIVGVGGGTTRMDHGAAGVDRG